MRKFLSAILFALNHCLYSQMAYFETGTLSKSMGNISSQIGDGFAVMNNPSLLVQNEQTEVCLFSENKFLMKELNLHAFALKANLKNKNAIGFGVYRWGFELFNQTRATLGYAMHLSPTFSVGVALNYISFAFADIYGQKSALYANLGFTAKVNDQWYFAGSVDNVNRAKIIDQYNELLTTILRLGTTYAFSDQLKMSLEAVKNHLYPVSIRTGIYYQITAPLAILCGYQTSPNKYTAGLQYHWNKIKFGTAMEYHPVLGISPSISLHYIFEKKIKNAPQQ